jgi:hypothetical protein
VLFAACRLVRATLTLDEHVLLTLALVLAAAWQFTRTKRRAVLAWKQTGPLPPQGARRPGVRPLRDRAGDALQALVLGHDACAGEAPAPEKSELRREIFDSGIASAVVCTVSCRVVREVGTCCRAVRSSVAHRAVQTTRHRLHARAQRPEVERPDGAVRRRPSQPGQ